MTSYLHQQPTMQTYILKTLSLIAPFEAVHHRKVRVGGLKDGGYVMLDDIDRVTTCYSLGVGPDVTWDDDMARRGSVIFQYDHTVQGPPTNHSNFRFNRVGITHDEVVHPEMKRIASLIRENDHGSTENMLLKIDIEGFEWDVLAGLPLCNLKQFSQIVVEFHGLRLLENDNFRERADRVFRHLNETHRVVHVHGNNFAGLHVVEGVAIADVIELTFANRSLYEFKPSSEVYPTTLDAPCDPNKADIFLGSFRFA